MVYEMNCRVYIKNSLVQFIIEIRIVVSLKQNPFKSDLVGFKGFPLPLP